MALFGAMYFVQGIAEPTEGLIAQPVRSLLEDWNYSVSEIATFMALLALPWTLKPLYGLASDFLPIAGTHRRSYLLLSTAATVLGLGWLWLRPPQPEHGRWALLALLLLPTLGVAVSDVVVDALMVERGQPLGLTGRLQSVQWCAMYAATILVGVVGGYLSQRQRSDLGFLICSLATLASFGLAVWSVREPRRSGTGGELRTGLRALWLAARSPRLLAAAAFVALWSFNPFSATVLQLYTTDTLQLDRQFYGTTVSCLAVGSMLATIAYGAYAPHVRFSRLIHIAIAMGIASTLAYWGYRDRLSGLLVSGWVGFSYMTGSLVMYDLAARSCPVEAAGTTFAALMGLSNLSFALSTGLGGHWYEARSRDWGAVRAFQMLVLVGAATTALTWLVVPWLQRVEPAMTAAPPSSPPSTASPASTSS